MSRPLLFVLGLVLAGAPALAADDLFQRSQFAGLAHDTRATQVGDALTVVVFQSAEARNSARNARSRQSTIEGGLQTPGDLERGRISLGGEYDGHGEVRRSETFMTQISVTVRDVLPNGDLFVSGEQRMMVNGEETLIAIRGRVRPVDISSDNQVLSTYLADAEISYGGEGFVSSASQPGLFHRLFSVLGLN